MPESPPRIDEEYENENSVVEKFDSKLENDSSPLVYVKVGRYNDILGQIQQLRSLSLGLRDALDALGEIEKEVSIGIVVANKTLDDLSVLIKDLELRFSKNREIVEKHNPTIPKNIEDYVKKSYEKTEKLKKNFRKLEKIERLEGFEK